MDWLSFPAGSISPNVSAQAVLPYGGTRRPKSPTLPKEISVNGAHIPLTRNHLRLVASWIRNVLDPSVARDGPEVLHPDDVLTLHELFLQMAADANGNSLPLHTLAENPTRIGAGNEITAGILRYSRLHFAVLEIAGKATRWPGKLADECDLLIEVWERKFGNLNSLRPFLFGMGGRLTGIAGTGDSTRAGLLKLWSFSCPDKLIPARSKKHGSLEFAPGSWWINGMFACHAGIIDIDTTDGGICFDQNGAYALVLKDDTEVEGSSIDTFTYRCQPRDRGRFRLTSADSKSRWPIRVLRSHSLSSLWAPKVGIRYDGLYRVTGWSIKHAKQPTEQEKEKGVPELVFEVTFRREPNETSMEEVLRHPLADEVDDYMEYKRLRQKRKENPKGAKVTFNESVPPTESTPSQVTSDEPPLQKTPGKLASVREAARLSTGEQPVFFIEPSEDMSSPGPVGTGASKRGSGLIESLPGFKLSIPSPITAPVARPEGAPSNEGSQATSRTGSHSGASGTSGASGISAAGRSGSRRSLEGLTRRIGGKRSEKETGPPSSRLNTRSITRKPSIFAKLLEGTRSTKALDGVDERPEEWEIKACKDKSALTNVTETELNVRLSPRQCSQATSGS